MISDFQKKLNKILDRLLTAPTFLLDWNLLSIEHISPQSYSGLLSLLEE